MNYLQTCGCNINLLGSYSYSPLDLLIAQQALQETVLAFLNMGAKGSNVHCFADLAVGYARKLLDYISEDLFKAAYSAGQLQEAMTYFLIAAIAAGDLSSCERLKRLGCSLVKAPASPMCRCGNCSPLIFSLHHNRPRVVTWLLREGGAVWGLSQCLSKNAETPLSFAISRRLNDVLPDILYHLQDSWPSSQDYCGYPPVVSATQFRNYDGLKIILDFLQNQRSQIRSQRGRLHTPTSQQAGMITQNASKPLPSLSDVLNGRSAIMPLHQASIWGDIKAIKILLKYGARLDARNTRGKTALFQAVVEEQREALRFLLSQTAELVSLDEEISLSFKVARMQRTYDIVALLESHVNGSGSA
ncbi:ankyrin repeat-containing domain protein [Aspergillus multicolor]|uniref:ankyrin repeat domain-containing protein n=1 Tax=Aspergillus multicolor TaxID=41759 RepID=UPI003CCDA40E